MNKNQLLDMMGSIRDSYVLEAMDNRDASTPKARPRLRLHRVGLLAAVLAATLLLAGCVAVYLHLQDLSIGKYTRVQSYDRTGRAIEPTDQELEVLNFSGVAGSPEQKASAQWYEFRENYDSEHALTTNVVDNPDIPNNYEYTYGCYTREMVTKLDEIIGENQLELLEDEVPIQRWHSDIAMEALGKNSLLREGADAQMGPASGFLFAPYNFKLEYDLTLTGDSPAWSKTVGVTQLFQRKGYLPYNGYWNVDMDAFRQWNYTTSQGVTLLMAMDDAGSCFMVRQLDSGILMVAINGNGTGSRYPDPDQVPGKEAMEAYAEAIDFSASYPAFDFAAIRPKLEEADKAYEAAHTFEEKVYSTYRDYLIGYDYGWWPGQQYVFYDLNGDGTEELLLGSEGYCNTWLTQKNGQVEERFGWNFRPCQDGTAEIYEGGGFSSFCRYRYLPLDEVVAEVENYSEYLEIEYQNGQWRKCSEPTALDENYQSITEEDADAIRAQHPAVKLDWIPIEDFPMDEAGTTLGQHLRSQPQPGREELRTIYADHMRHLRELDESFFYTYYRFADVNGDGTEELLLSGDGEQYWTIYGYRFGKLRPFFNYNFYLCEDNVLERVSIYHQWYTSGGETEEHIFYRIGKELDSEVLDYAAYNKATASWQSDQDGTPLDTAEAEAILAKYHRVDQGMHPISELIG